MTFVITVAFFLDDVIKEPINWNIKMPSDHHDFFQTIFGIKFMALRKLNVNASTVGCESNVVFISFYFFYPVPKFKL